MSTQIDPRALSEAGLRFLVGACTELTCPHHGAFNAELRRRETTTPTTERTEV